MFLADSKLVKRDHEKCLVNVFQDANILTIEYVIPPSHKKCNKDVYLYNRNNQIIIFFFLFTLNKSKSARWYTTIIFTLNKIRNSFSYWQECSFELFKST